MVAVDRADRASPGCRVHRSGERRRARRGGDSVRTGRGLAFDPGGAELAVAYDGSSGAPAIGRFEVPSGRAAGGFSGPAGLLRAALVPPGRTLARARCATTVSGGDARSSSGPSTPRTPRSRSGPGRRTPFSPAPRRWRSPEATSKASLAVVDIETGEVVRSIEILDIGSTPASPSIRPAHRLALVSSAAEQVVVVDLDRGEPVETLDVVGPQSADFSDDGRWLAVGSFDNLVHLFDTEDFAETLLAGSPTLVAEVSFAPDSSRLASISAGQVRFWDLAEGSPRSRQLRHVRHGCASLSSAKASRRRWSRTRVPTRR